jgi:precorrin-2 dehydrogenase/sirohydrochlorin ferrochelatase
MSYYPIMLDLQGKRAVVIGGGQVAQRKIETLLRYEAEVCVVAHELSFDLKSQVASGKVKWIAEEYDQDGLDGAFLVIAATDDAALNRRVSGDAKRKGILINAVDQPADCTFIVPSILERGDLLIAISTSGQSPMLAKKIRRTLETQFGKEYALFLRLMGRLRKEILAQGFSQDENRRIFHDLVESPILEAIGQERWDAVASMIKEIAKKEWSAEEIPALASKE